MVLIRLKLVPNIYCISIYYICVLYIYIYIYIYMYMYIYILYKYYIYTVFLDLIQIKKVLCKL